MKTNHWIWAGYGLLFATLLLWQLRILSYVSAQDPSQIYIPMALDLVETDWSIDTFRTISQRISPGWPLILSGCLKLFGRYSPYWINLFFCFGFFWMLGTLLRPSLDTHRDVFVILFGVLLLCLGGTQLNPHFLLYAFRDLPTMFFLLAALCLLAKGKGWRAFFAAGLCWGVGIGLKEIALAALPVFIWYGTRYRRSSMGWFFLPLLIALLAGLVLNPAGVDSIQARRVIGSLGDSIGQKGLAVVDMLLTFSRTIFFVGWLLVVPGCLLARRKPEFMALLGIGLCVGLMYTAGVPRYPSHDRYFLSVFLWFLPLFGLGLVGLLKKTKSAWHMREGVIGFCALVLVYQSFHAGAWDTPVPRSEIVALRKSIKPHVPKDAWIVINPAYRMAAGAVDCFTRTKRADRYAFQAQVEAGEPVFFIDSADEGALHPNSRAQWGLKPREMALADYDLEHLVDFELAARTYRLYAIRKRTQTTRDIVIDRPGKFGRLFWLDLRNSSPATLVWEGRGSYTLDRKLSCLLMPDDLASYPVRWTLESETPLPRRVRHRAESHEKKSFWSLETRYRSRSSLEWFEPPFIRPSPRLIQGVVCRTGGVFRVPIPLNVPVLSVQVDLAWKRIGPLGLQIWLNDQLLHEDAADGPRDSWTHLELKGPFTREPRLRFVLTDIANERDVLYLRRLKLKYQFDDGN